jgi:hypothetical protein
MEDTCLDSKVRLERMSFLFPPVFKDMLLNLKRKHNKDMTYIVMEAVNEWAIKKENISSEMINNGGEKE